MTENARESDARRGRPLRPRSLECVPLLVKPKTSISLKAVPNSSACLSASRCRRTFLDESDSANRCRADELFLGNRGDERPRQDARGACGDRQMGPRAASMPASTGLTNQAAPTREPSASAAGQPGGVTAYQPCGPSSSRNRLNDSSTGGVGTPSSPAAR